MGFYQKYIQPFFNRGATDTKDNPYSDATFFANNHAGVNVTYNAAMRQQDVYTAVRIKSEAIGQLPVRLMRLDGRNKIPITSGREHRIFTIRPNQYQTWQQLIEQYVAACEITGNFYAEIRRNRFGNVYEIIPFKHQNAVSVNMRSDGVIQYTYSTNDGKGKISSKTFPAKDILHIPLTTTDGYTGISPITQAAQMIGSAIAGDKHTASLFENGARPSGILKTEHSFGDDDDEAQNAISRVKRQWNELYSGPENSGKTAVLELGMAYQSIQMSAVDAQLLEQRKFSREQIASIFRVPLHMLGSPDGMKYNTIDQTNTAFFRDSLMPLVTRLENHINELLPENHVIKLHEKEFVRGDRKTLVETVKLEFTNGFCSLADAKRDLDRPVVDTDEDMFAIDTNNITYGTWEDAMRLTEAKVKKAQKEAQPDPLPVQSEEPKPGDNNESKNSK